MALIQANWMMLSPVKVGGFVLWSRWRSYIVKMGIGTIVVICDIRETTASLGGFEKLLVRRFGGGVQLVTIVNADFVMEDPCYVSGW